MVLDPADRAVLAVACEPRTLDGIRGTYELRAVEDFAATPAELDGVGVVLVGARVNAEGVRRILDVARTRGACEVVRISAERSAGPSGVFYVLAPELASTDAHAIVDAAMTRSRGLPTCAQLPAPPSSPTSPAEAHDLHRVLTASRVLAAQADIGHAAAHIVGALRELATAGRAYCWFHDAASGELWRQGEGQLDGEHTASLGIVGFVARTGQSVCAASSDPRFHADIDDPSGRGSERLLVEPVIGPDREVHAVFVAVRGRREQAFDHDDRRRIATLASCCGPAIHQLGLQLEHEITPEAGLFRAEAVEEHARRNVTGDVIRVAPGWVPFAYVAVVMFVLAAAAYVALGRIDHYSTGPAVVRILGRTEVTANTPGTIAELMVGVGDRVEAGDVLARLYDNEPAGERLQREFDEALRDHLRDEDDDAAGQSLRNVRSELERADQRERTLLVRAPHAAVVGDLRVRVGQAVAPGDIVASLVADGALELIAILPGSDRPMLAPGQPLRIDVQGFPHAYDDLVVDTVGQEVVGPAELRRTLGPVAETLGNAGSAVIVHARLPATEFTADHGRYAYYDGMLARAHVRLRRQRVLDVLLPDLGERGAATP